MSTREPDPPEGMRVFDRRLVRARRDRWAGAFADHDFLFREVADRLADRLQDTTRRFPRALDLGSRAGVLAGVAPRDRVRFALRDRKSVV